MIAAALLLAAAQPDPRTVNGDVLGPAQKFTTAGPARVCMDELMLTALPGESVTLDYAGIHAGTLRLNRHRAWVKTSLGDIFVQPKERGDVIQRRSGSFIADSSSDERLRYGLFAPDDYHRGYHLRVWIDGPSLSGAKSDEGILRRVELRTDKSPPCDVTYHYGWKMLFGEQPLMEKRRR